MTSDSKTEVGSYFISNYPPYSAWKKDNLGAIRDAGAAGFAVISAVAADDDPRAAAERLVRGWDEAAR